MVRSKKHLTNVKCWRTREQSTKEKGKSASV